jgi:uncharacterized membrane protein
LRTCPSSLVVAGFALLVLSLTPSKVACQAPAQPAQPSKKPMVGPPSPQSTHYPILLLAFGNDPNWSLRIGQKGPERLDRPGYPPIPLEPAEVTHEAGADSWTYHAKDSATGVAVVVHLARESCSGAAVASPSAMPSSSAAAPPSPVSKYSFTASVDHAQLGTLQGCARIAAELFPKINNQPDEDEDADKKKPPPPTITNFKSPVATAYTNLAAKIVFKRGATIHTIAAESYQLAVSHDGSRLLYTREDKGGNRAIILYEFANEKSTELVRGNVQEAFWSPDDTRFAFMKYVEGQWRLLLASVASPDGAASTYPGAIISIHGWADTHTILVDDFNQLSWVGEDGTVQRTVSLKDAYGEVFSNSSINKIRIHPLNPDLLLVSAEISNPPAGMPKDPHTGGSIGFALFELRSRRRVLMTPPNMLAQDAEWSRDGLQIFFTGSDSTRRPNIYRIFWDGTGLQKYAAGSGLVVGQ